VEHLTDAAAIQPLLQEFFDQHLGRWAGTPTPSLFRRPHNQELYRALVRNFAGSGQVIFSVVRLGGRPVAQHFGLLSRGDLLWYKPTFDIELARHSPGEVLLKSLVEYARDRGLGGLDFTRGDEPFKFRFATRTLGNDSYLWARGLVPRITTRLKRSVRGALRRLLRPVRASALVSHD
jgi:CelD/BcsL family acetyltransferase involved in cellulose biosynthesis